MKKYRVEFNADIEVEADNESDALEKAEEELRDYRADEVCYHQDTICEDDKSY